MRSFSELSAELDMASATQGASFATPIGPDRSTTPLDHPIEEHVVGFIRQAIADDSASTEPYYDAESKTRVWRIIAPDVLLLQPGVLDSWAGAAWG